MRAAACLVLFVAIWVATLVLIPEAGMWTHIGLVFGGLLLLGPYLYVLSKTIWANLFFHYKGVELTEKEKAYHAERGR